MQITPGKAGIENATVVSKGLLFKEVQANTSIDGVKVSVFAKKAPLCDAGYAVKIEVPGIHVENHIDYLYGCYDVDRCFGGLQKDGEYPSQVRLKRGFTLKDKRTPVREDGGKMLVHGRLGGVIDRLNDNETLSFALHAPHSLSEQMPKIIDLLSQVAKTIGDKV